jgi:hypothetical protein
MKGHQVLGLLAGLVSLPVLAGDFEFVVIGDTRPRFESESFYLFQRLITNINRLQPALVVNLGDLIFGYGPLGKERQWDKYEAVIQAFRMPYYQVPGNHDTHSKEARKIYGRRFGKFYQSFDHGGCHFVLLDNTEEERWGYLGPAQLNWLKHDLEQSHPHSVFVFLHFPVWEADRTRPAYQEFWRQTLHPLFRQSHVRAVFAGHYHTYGPTREYDGIRYFITGGGGAELIPEYKQSGGSHHFMSVKVAGESFDVRVVTEHGEMTDAEADVMGGLQFAARNVSRIAIQFDAQGLRAGLPFTVTVKNPYAIAMRGQATWLTDASAFSIQPETVTLDVPSGETLSYTFTLKAQRDTAALSQLPHIEFNVRSGGASHRFRREVRFLHKLSAPYRAKPPTLDGALTDWEGIPALKLGDGPYSEAELRSCFDAQNLYLAITVPNCEDEAQESGFSDKLQIGLARPVDASSFGGDLLRLGFDSDRSEAKDRTPGHKAEAVIRGTKSVWRTEGIRTTHEICLPAHLVDGGKVGEGGRVMLDLSFPVSEREGQTSERPEPAVNTFSYRVRYGGDSLVPVYFVELSLERKRLPMRP